jgi:hypothetical protein
MHMRRHVARCALLPGLLVGWACTPTAGPVASDGASRPATRLRTTPLAVDSALVAIASRPLWPGFTPLASPLAIFDGTRTWLLRHPSPPAGYSALPARGDVFVRDGRDPAVTANSSAALGGVATATVFLRDDARSAEAVAALAVHELFHVFQRARHPGWQANEADLFTYPVENAVALALRREETAALTRAVAAPSVDSVRCWAIAFSDVRRRRFAVIGTAAAAYERGTELNEGLAQYVEQRAGGRPETLFADPAAAVVRQRSYDVGAALGLTLRRLRADWAEALERSASTTPALDSVLVNAAGGDGAMPSCVAAPAQRERWAEEARAEVRTIETERIRTRAEFLSRPGARLVIDARRAPLFPAGFDPLNVSRLSGAELLHSRFLTLQNDHGTIELLGGTALTEGQAGQHPLFAGVVRVVLAGLTRPPALRDSGAVMIVEAPGVQARLRRVTADVAGDSVVISWR